MLEALEADGFAIVPDVLTGATCDKLLAGFAACPAESPGTGDAAGIRNVLRDFPEARETACCDAVRRLVEPVLGPACAAVRGILFDKTPGANWKVVWHQDLSIAVRERREGLASWGPWSEKAGVVHVQPPPDLLSQMLVVRLHLDPCGRENGPLSVLPGTHRSGRLNAAQISRSREEIPETVCAVARGGAILMRPLLLHASSPATKPGHRRVLHIEFAAKALPLGLAWYEQVSPNSVA